MKYVDASAVLRVLFSEEGPAVPLVAGDRILTSQLLEVEAFRAVDRERLLGNLDDMETAVKRKELVELVALLDLVPINDMIIERAKASFAVNVRALDAIHVATAEILLTEASGEPLEFWTHNVRQATAALSRGLTVMESDAAISGIGCSRTAYASQPPSPRRDGPFGPRTPRKVDPRKCEGERTNARSKSNGAMHPGTAASPRGAPRVRDLIQSPCVPG
jgi:predicted nucleic acid-binding protein